MSFLPALHFVSLFDEFSLVITPLLAVFKRLSMMIVLRDLPAHYYALSAIQKVYFIITLVLLGPRMSVITRLQCNILSLASVCLLVCLFLCPSTPLCVF